jgi:hypothetical protein
LIHGDPRFAWDVAMFGVEPSRVAVPVDCYCIAEVTGPEAIMTMIPKLTEHRANRMCGAFRFCTVAPPFCRPTPIDERDIGPLISAWV